MKTVLNNGRISAMFESRGAELWSLCCGNINRIWCGDTSVWGEHSPLLFPFIGRHRNGEYLLEGKTYSAGIHGFCRGREFEIVKATDTLVRYSTCEDKNTMQIWPFRFQLEIEYELCGNTLVKRHIVTNHSDKPMPFEIGGHDAYAVALMPGETAADYAVAFEGTDAVYPFGMEEDTGMLTLPRGEIKLENGLLKKLPADAGLDSFVLGDLPVRKAKLIGLKSGLSVEIDFADFEYLGIWTMPVQNAGYICIEPWTTLPDGRFMTGELTERCGIQILAPAQSRTYTYTQTYV